MIEIGGKPILWAYYENIPYSYGHNDFILLWFYGHMIKDYFLNFASHMCDIEVDLSKINTQH